MLASENIVVQVLFSIYASVALPLQVQLITDCDFNHFKIHPFCLNAGKVFEPYLFNFVNLIRRL